jgi:DNA-directed RNA polymerase specialized sigma24 family protein
MATENATARRVLDSEAGEPKRDPGTITLGIRAYEAGKRGKEVWALWDWLQGEFDRYARSKAGGAARVVADVEDAFAQACDKILQGIESGELRLEDRIALRRELQRRTRKELDNIRRRHRTGKRGHGQVVSASSIEGEDVIRNVPSREFGPLTASAAREAYKRLLDALGDEQLQEVVLWKFFGCDNKETGKRIGLSAKTVEAKLRLIRLKWADEVAGLKAKCGRRKKADGPRVRCNRRDELAADVAMPPIPEEADASEAGPSIDVSTMMALLLADL